MQKLRFLALAAILALPLQALADQDGASGDHCKRHAMDFSKADKNGDGFIDKDEAQAMHEQHFNEMDTNHDGKLSKEELMACHHKGAHSSMHEKGTQAFNSADKDHDGKLTRDEAKQLPRVAKNFDAIDTDKDGTVDREEIHRYMADHPAK